MDGLGAEFCTAQLLRAAGEIGCGQRNAKRGHFSIGDKDEAGTMRLTGDGANRKAPTIQGVRGIGYFDFSQIGLVVGWGICEI